MLDRPALTLGSPAARFTPEWSLVRRSALRQKRSFSFDLRISSLRARMATERTGVKQLLRQESLHGLAIFNRADGGDRCYTDPPRVGQLTKETEVIRGSGV